MVKFKEIYHFSRSNCLFPIETHITCDFPGVGGGSGPPVPPPPPLWIRTCLKNYCFGGIYVTKYCFNQPIKSHIGKLHLHVATFNILFTELSWIFCGHWSLYIILHSNLKTLYRFSCFFVCAYVVGLVKW